jgi:hypothetical protein
MKTLLVPVLLVALSFPTFSQNSQGGNNNNQGGNNNNQGGNYRGAPGPIVGAGLPILLIGGGIIYWSVRRRKKAG